MTGWGGEGRGGGGGGSIIDRLAIGWREGWGGRSSRTFEYEASGLERQRYDSHVV